MSLVAAWSWSILQWHLLFNRKATILLLGGWTLLLVGGLVWDSGLLGLAGVLPIVGVVASCACAWGGREERALRKWVAPLRFRPAALLPVTLLARASPWGLLVLIGHVATGPYRPPSSGTEAPPALLIAVTLLLGFGALGLLVSVLLPGDQNAFLLVVAFVGTMAVLPALGPEMGGLSRVSLALVNPLLWMTPLPSWEGLAGAGGTALAMVLAAVALTWLRSRPQFRDEIGLVLRVDGLSKEFRSLGRRSHVLRGVSFSVPAGKVVGLLGRNGAGKTTTLRVVVGDLDPTQGKVRWGAVAPCQVRWLPEGDGFAEGLAPRSYLAVMGARRGDVRTGALAAALGVEHLLDRPAGELSTGQRRRCAILVTLAAKVQLYVLDEIGAGIDPVELAAIKRVLGDLAVEGSAVLLSTHLLREFEECIDHVVMIDGGRVIADGEVRALRESLAVVEGECRTRAVGGTGPTAIRVDGRLIVSSESLSGLQQDPHTETCSVARGSATLEDVFHWHLQQKEGR